MQKKQEKMHIENLEKRLKSCYSDKFRQSVYKSLYMNSARMIKNAKIVQNISDAIYLRKALDKILNHTDHPIEDSFGLANILHSKFYQHIVDDIVICSAFEMYAKATLLKKQYVVQNIDYPNNRKKEQKIKPIHLRTLMSDKSKGIIWRLSKNTLPVSLLLKNCYFSKITKHDKLRSVLVELNNRRNLLHYNVASAYAIEMPMLTEINFLINTINKNA